MSQFEREPIEKPPLILRLLLNRRSRQITLAVLSGVILLGGGIWYWSSNQSVVDGKTISQADFAVYAPKQAPDGYTVDNDRTSLKGGILTYVFDDQSENKDITITVQDKPDGFDIAQISKDGSVNSISTASGILYNLSAGASIQYMLDTGESLVYITSQDKVDNTLIVEIADSLKKYN